MKKARFVVSPPALEDLDATWLFIARDSAEAADRIQRQIRDTFYLLAGQPRMGHRREELTDKPVLFWPVGSYLIVYDPGKRPLEIVRVLHGARDVKSILEN